MTIHWHGVDVPNAEDGVAGVTQNAVLPGERYSYRFRAEQVGTFWYHTHQVSSKDVRRGLFGVLVIEPSPVPAAGLDLVAAVHTFDGVPTINGSDELERRKVEPGTPVRLRLVNTDSFGQQVTLSGSPFRVVAIDGTDLNGPTPLERPDARSCRRRPDRRGVHDAGGGGPPHAPEVERRTRAELGRYGDAARGGARSRLRPSRIRAAERAPDTDADRRRTTGASL